jgi:hypothetical protein
VQRKQAYKYLPAHGVDADLAATAEGNIGLLLVGHMMTSEVVPSPRDFLGVVTEESRQEVFSLMAGFRGRR